MGLGMGNDLPNVPDPTKVANSLADGVKIVADQAAVVGQSVVECAGNMATTTAKGMIASADHVAKDFVTGLEANIIHVKTTGDKIKRAFQFTAEGVRTQVDQGIGGEVVRKFKNEVERVLK